MLAIYLSRNYRRKGVDHFLVLSRSSDLGIQIYLQANSKNALFLLLPFVLLTVDSAAQIDKRAGKHSTDPFEKIITIKLKH